MNQSSGIGGILKTLAMIIGVLCLIGGIILGNAFGYTLFSDGRSSFNWSIALSSWLMSAILCSIIYAIGEIVDQLSAIRQMLESLAPGKALPSFSGTLFSEPASALQVTQAVEPVKPVAPLQPVAPVQQTEKEQANSSNVSGKWVCCEACGEKATMYYARIRKHCPNCGTPYAL